MAEKENTLNKMSTQNSSSAKIVKCKQEMTQQKILENCIVLWLDENLDFSTDHSQKWISQLRNIVNTIETFNDIDICLEYLTQLKDEKIFFIVSASLLNQIAVLEDKFIQLTSIYVLCDNAVATNDNVKAFKKGKGIFTTMNHLCSELQNDVRQVEKNLTCSTTISSSPNLDPNELPPTFMYCHLLKEKFFKLEDDPNAKDEYIEYCKPQYEKDKHQKYLAERFLTTYDRASKTESPIWWYTMECFLYKMLNHALWTLDIEILMKMSFYIRDLHEQISERYSNPKEKHPSVVYRGQELSEADFRMLKKGDLFAFNNFLSTTIVEEIARKFLKGPSGGPDRVGILWKIEIDSSASSVPFTAIEDITAMKKEFEVLFSIGAVFRIGDLEEREDNETNFWQVKLTLTDGRDPSLNRITDCIRRSLGPGTGWRPLAQLMIKMNHFSKAKEIYEKLKPDDKTGDKVELTFFHNQLGYIEKQMGHLTEALDHYQKAIDSSKECMSPKDARLSSVYSNLGAILKKLKDFDGALKYFELVLEIDRTTADPNRLEIAIDYNNIGSILDDQGKYSEALKNYEKALEIKLVHLPAHHPSLANNYSNIGVVHRKMGDCSTALSYYKKTLTIQNKSLQPNHSALIVTHSNMATALENLGRINEAIEHAKMAANIAKNAFGEKHSETNRRAQILHELEKRR
ncbi:hypothetical protein I4U23_012166 [Adineta vaga]|nr:hypothetical protein I4U23_012166 [Adineta vaga]